MRLNKFIGYSIDDSSAVVCPNTATCRFLAPGKKRAVALVDERSCDPRSLFDSGRQVAKTSVSTFAAAVSQVMSFFGIFQTKSSDMLAVEIAL